MAQEHYLSTDPNAGTPIGGYLSGDPAAGKASAVPPANATREFFGPHHAITEGGDPADALSKIEQFLTTYVNPGLQGAARPQGLGDVMGLVVPSAVPEFRVPLVNMVREALEAGRDAPRLRNMPRAVLERLASWATTSSDDLASQRFNAKPLAEQMDALPTGGVNPERGRMSGPPERPRPASGMPPRPAGNAPNVQDSLMEALQALRAQMPDAVSLPGGNTWRASGPTPSLPSPSGPRMGAWSAEPTPSVARPGTSAGAPPAAAPRAPSRPAQTPGLRLTEDEAQAVQQLLAEGYPETEVLQAIANQRPQAAAAPSARAAGKPQLSAAETKEFQRLTSRGKSPQEALELIETQRAFQQRLGLPTSEQTRRSVVDRNETGHW